ncbi:MAG TPA: hypothetical protein VGI86_01330 [Acidimicrobiia bacterium]
MRWKTVLASCTALLAVGALVAPATSSASASTTKAATHKSGSGSGTGIAFVYNITASTHIKKLNEDVTIKGGVMKATVDIATGKLTGSLTLPPATVTTTEAGLPVLTATFDMKEAKPVTGKINFSTFKVTATSVFNILITKATAGPIPVNLVGNKCATATPVSVTMSGKASFTGPSTFTGSYTIPQFANCSLATPVLNQLIPGPGNSFKAVATPKS